MKYGGGLAAGILFELHLNHYHPMPDIGVACLDPLLKPGATRREGWTYNAANITEDSTAAEYKAAADYTATVGESLQNFKDRIIADLRAKRDLGHVVHVYAHGSFFDRNAAHLIRST